MISESLQITFVFSVVGLLGVAVCILASATSYLYEIAGYLRVIAKVESSREVLIEAGRKAMEEA